MSLTLAIAINLAAVVSLLGGLAFVMSRAALLSPHLTSPHNDLREARRPARHQATRRVQRPSHKLATVGS